MGGFRALACPACFINHGFVQVAKRHARRLVGPCPNCGASGELKLNRPRLSQALVEFFVRGSLVAETYAPVFQVNDRNPHPARLDPTIADDAALACRLTGLVVFNYGPPLWRLGITTHWEAFNAGGDRRRVAAEALVQHAAKAVIPAATHLYRIRLNVKADEGIADAETFDPPPPNVVREQGRWDEPSSPVLYVADDLELCLHECRVTISDEIVAASLTTTRDIQVLDLTADMPLQGGTSFDDPNVFIGVMCRSRGYWLDYCREIARATRAAGYDGIRYKSYYSQAKGDRSAVNLALFGRPISDGWLRIESVNRISITDMRYRFEFGPVLYRDQRMREEVASWKAKYASFQDKAWL
jgi:hypothetical protein